MNTRISCQRNSAEPTRKDHDCLSGICIHTHHAQCSQ